ncbi:MAG TPA: hypothetical protein DDZ39_06920 [Flavobacteriaceae bacterium]|jgi:hypothetical protein|nr:hypothetical protein [Flavobacteriaceae bacterium]HBS12500.1 hypothetical protein [Flavobacteriaceae bacterium]
MKNIFLFLVLTFNICNAQLSDFKTIDFVKADSIAKINEGASLANLPILAQSLTQKLPTQVEKFRAIYTWVCSNITGDINQHNKISRKRKKFQSDSLSYLKWNNKHKKIAFKKLLKHKKTMCTGYAYLIKELCFLANIECEIIDGYGRTVYSNIESLELINHSWNAVKLNNKWYLCDATWSSGYVIENALFVKDYNEGYFLAEPLLFVKNHYPVNKKWLLNETLINTEFIASPLVYGEAFKHEIIPISPEIMNVAINKNSEINFSFKSLKKSLISKTSLVKISNGNEKLLTIYHLKNKNGLIEFKHKFKHKGFFDVHLKIDKDIVATYTINVM